MEERRRSRFFINQPTHTPTLSQPHSYLAYGAVYTALEVLAVPAIPLTMTAGAIFGVPAGTAVVSASATLAATAAFVIARYLARDKVQAYAAKSPKFAAVDAAIGRNGFKVVTLLRMSPLLPLAASSYLYGLTSVDLPSYVAGSWLGMLPGTIAYVAAGHYGREVLVGGEGAAAVEPWQLALGATLSLASLAYVGRLATQALQEEAGLSEGDEKKGG